MKTPDKTYAHSSAKVHLLVDSIRSRRRRLHGETDEMACCEQDHYCNRQPSCMESDKPGRIAQAQPVDSTTDSSPTGTPSAAFMTNKKNA